MRAGQPGTKKRLRTMAGCLLLVIAAMAVFCAGCTENGDEMASGTTATAGIPVVTETEVTYTGDNVSKVELYHFSGNQSCATCTLLGYLAETTVTEEYAPELASGRLVFAHVNYDLPENHDITERYGPTGSSLWIGVYDENGFYAQELIAPWYMTGDRAAFRDYLKAVLDQQLP